jgi:predicted metal-dependent phosphoesterase TrpH
LQSNTIYDGNAVNSPHLGVSMLADLHIHSVYSDGSYSPDEICRRAASRGIGLISITDHDTLAGLEAKRACAEKHGLSYLSGWEVSAYEGRVKVHVLGYGCKTEGAYESFVKERAEASFLRAKDSVEKFQKIGVPVTFEEVLAERSSPDLPVHTMHIARAANRYLGIFQGEVYERYLAPGKPANSNIGRPTPYQAIDCIHAAGGVAVIAHPGRITLNFEDREQLLTRLCEYGADGIECAYPTHTEKDTEYFRALVKKYALFETGGSDMHYEDGVRAIGSPQFSPSSKLLEKLRIL